MAHECPECGQECYCDMEDHWQEAPDDCSHECQDFEDTFCGNCGAIVEDGGLYCSARCESVGNPGNG